MEILIQNMYSRRMCYSYFFINIKDVYNDINLYHRLTCICENDNFNILLHSVLYTMF